MSSHFETTGAGSPPGVKRELKMEEIGKTLMDCQHCHEKVQLQVLPFHEKLCGEAKAKARAYRG
jgi:hypothetical protein